MSEVDREGLSFHLSTMDTEYGPVTTIWSNNWGDRPYKLILASEWEIALWDELRRVRERLAAAEAERDRLRETEALARQLIEAYWRHDTTAENRAFSELETRLILR